MKMRKIVKSQQRKKRIKSTPSSSSGINSEKKKPVLLDTVTNAKFGRNRSSLMIQNRKRKMKKTKMRLQLSSGECY